MSKEKDEKVKANESERTFISDLKDDIDLLVDEAKEFIDDAKDDVETIVEATHIKDFLHDAKDDLNLIIDETQIESFVHDASDDLHLIIDELEEKAQKTKTAILNRFAESKNKKDEVVVKSADSLIEAINKVKCALAECEKE